MFNADQKDITKELKKIDKGLKASHNELMGRLDAGHNELMGRLDAGHNEIVDKPNANRNGPVGDQTTLDDIKAILLRIEQHLTSGKG